VLHTLTRVWGTRPPLLEDLRHRHLGEEAEMLRLAEELRLVGGDDVDEMDGLRRQPAIVEEMARQYS